jgi:hypothetical protein
MTFELSLDMRFEDLSFRLLGPLEVAVHGRLLSLTGRQRALCAALLLEVNHVVSLDRLVDMLWGKRPPAPTRVDLVEFEQSFETATKAAALDNWSAALENFDHALSLWPGTPIPDLPENPERQRLEELRATAAEGASVHEWTARAARPAVEAVSMFVNLHRAMVSCPSGIIAWRWGSGRRRECRRRWGRVRRGRPGRGAVAAER